MGRSRAGCRRWQELDAPYETARARMALAAVYRAAGDPETAALEVAAARSGSLAMSPRALSRWPYSMESRSAASDCWRRASSTHSPARPCPWRSGRVAQKESQETGTAPITAPEIGRVRALPNRDAVVEPADPPRGLGQQLEVLRRQRLRQVDGAQPLERLAPRVTPERLAARGKLVFPAVPHRLSRMIPVVACRWSDDWTGL